MGAVAIGSVETGYARNGEGRLAGHGARLARVDVILLQLAQAEIDERIQISLDIQTSAVPKVVVGGERLIDGAGDGFAGNSEGGPVAIGIAGGAMRAGEGQAVVLGS